MWGAFVTNRENYGCQKMNLIIHVKKNEKSWILKTVNDKQLLNFSDFIKFLCLINLEHFLSQDSSPVST